MITDRAFVIVGASLTGAKAAETLGSEGFDGRIVLFGAEPEQPYERPPLSKDYLREESPRENAYVHPEAFYAENDIELRTSATATAIDPRARDLVLVGGEAPAFARLLITTGAEPRRLGVPGADLDRVLYTDPSEAERLLDEAAQAGVDLTTITAELERAGAASFCASYEELLDCIRPKLAALEARGSRAGAPPR